MERDSSKSFAERPVNTGTQQRLRIDRREPPLGGYLTRNDVLARWYINPENEVAQAGAQEGPAFMGQARVLSVAPVPG